MRFMISRKKFVGDSSGSMMLKKCCIGFVLLIVVVLISECGIVCSFV